MEKGDYDWWGGSGSTSRSSAGLVAGCVGVGFVGPELGRIDKAAQEHGPDSELVRARFSGSS